MSLSHAVVTPSHANATLYPPPLADTSLAPIEHPLSVTRVDGQEQDIFTNTFPLWQPPPPRSVNGGLMMGASIQAAYQTVPTHMDVYHFNCSFLARPDHSMPVFYLVSRVRDGRSVATREVKAVQDGVVFFSAELNFSTTGRPGSLVHETKIPQLAGQSMQAPPPLQNLADNERELTDEIVLPTYMIHRGPKTTRQQIDPFAWRQFAPVRDAHTSAPTNIIYSWVRTRGDMSSHRNSHMAVLAFLTDCFMITSFPEMNPDAAAPDGSNIAFMSSINHNIWFHDPSVRLDEWLLHSKSSSWAGEGRALFEQKLWTKEGKLVASSVQEAAMRLKKPVSEEAKVITSKI